MNNDNQIKESISFVNPTIFSFGQPQMQNSQLAHKMIINQCRTKLQFAQRLIDQYLLCQQQKQKVLNSPKVDNINKKIKRLSQKQSQLSTGRYSSSKVQEFKQVEDNQPYDLVGYVGYAGYSNSLDVSHQLILQKYMTPARRSKLDEKASASHSLEQSQKTNNQFNYSINSTKIIMQGAHKSSEIPLVQSLLINSIQLKRSSDTQILDGQQRNRNQNYQNYVKFKIDETKIQQLKSSSQNKQNKDQLRPFQVIIVCLLVLAFLLYTI